MASVTFDDSQKKAITTEINSVVSAGAGSGKTSVLSSRFEHLVTHKKMNVSEILTLTFTKKATIEMYGRIYKKLCECAPSAAAEFDKANIKTLDSYCASIARLGSHFYGLSPDFAVDEETIKESISKLALPFLLQHQNNDAVRALVSTSNYDEIANELFVFPLLAYSTLSSPIDFFAAQKKQAQYIKSEWDAVSTKALDAVHSLTSLLADFDGNRNTVFIKALTAALEKECPERPSILDGNFESGNIDSLLSFITFLKNVSSPSPRGNGTDAIKEVFYPLRDYVASLSSIANYVYGFPIANAVLPLLEDFQKKVNATKRSSASLTYTDSSSLALSILKEHLDIRSEEKQKYKSIMIDEFQDNNSLQRDMLFMLAEKSVVGKKGVPSVADLHNDKLFFVGDEKQSIYRFRGADVSVFRSLSKDFAQGNLSLKTNYRSHPALIAGFNSIFGGAVYPEQKEEPLEKAPAVFFTSPSEDIPDYEAVYSNADFPEKKKKEIASLAKNQTAYKKYFTPRIHVALYDTNQPVEKDQAYDEEAEALWVAKKIKSLLEKNISASDIAILFRTYSLQPLYERTLLAEGIPYNTETITGFFNSAPVTDTFAFLRICAYPKDSVAYEKVLHSPFVNLNNDEADAILSYSTIPFESPAEKILCTQSLSRYESAKELFLCVKKMSESKSLTDTVTYLWYNAGYRYETLWNERVSMYASLYDRIFELARLADENALGLAEFVDSVRTYEDEAKHLDNMDIPLEQNDGVHLLTIFKSKGLQYKIVFVCGAHKNGANDKNDTPVYVSKEFGVTINTPPHPALGKNAKNYFFEKVRTEEKRKASAELRRLTYVALTRAEEEVFITGKSNMDFSKAMRFCPNSTEAAPRNILDVLLPCISFYSEAAPEKSPLTIETILPQEKIKPTQNTSKSDVIKKISTVFESATVKEKPFIFPPSISPSAFKKADDEADENLLQSFTQKAPFPEINKLVASSIPQNAGENAKPRFSYADFGSIAHAYFEAALKGVSPSVPQKLFLSLSEDEKKVEEVKKICQKLTSSFLSTPLAQSALQSDFLKTEFSFRSRVGNELVNGQIDLLFRNKDGTFCIVDYKTNQTIAPEIYYTQLAFYRHAISKMFFCEEKNISCILYYMRFAKAIDISAECEKINLESAIQEIKEQIRTLHDAEKD